MKWYAPEIDQQAGRLHNYTLTRVSFARTMNLWRYDLLDSLDPTTTLRFKPNFGFGV